MLLEEVGQVVRTAARARVGPHLHRRAAAAAAATVVPGSAALDQEARGRTHGQACRQGEREGRLGEFELVVTVLLLKIEEVEPACKWKKAKKNGVAS